MHRVERRFGSFARRFALPEDADDQAIRAESRDGVVTIHIPKQKVVQPAAAPDPGAVRRGRSPTASQCRDL